MQPNNMAYASATAKGVLSTAASYAATLMLFRSIARQMIPNELYNLDMINKIFSRWFSNEVTMVIHEKDGLINNEIYEAAELYLSSKLSPPSTDKRLSVSKQHGDKDFKLKMENNEVIIDTFNNVKFSWVFICKDKKPTRNQYRVVSSESRSFPVSYPKKYKEMALESYLPYILKEANSILQQKKILKIFTMCSYSGGRWTPIKLDHPATFNTIAIDEDLKISILKDLDRFVKRKVYYRNAGKVWRRGYLLYGPPGTGKSSLIAAIANHLNFDVYDLELTQIRNNSDLKRVLLATANRSILVVEDIDCTIQLNNRLTTAVNPLRPNATSDKKQKEDDDQEEEAEAKKIKVESVVKVEDEEQAAKPDEKDDVKANDGTMGEENDVIGEEEDHMEEEEEEEEANAYIVEEEDDEYDSESSAAE